MKTVDLPSGSKLVISLSPFNEAWELFTAVAEDMKHVKLNPTDEIDANFWKDLACTALSSKKIYSCLAPCLKRSMYNNVAISSSTFEAADARQDYLVVLMEVAKENLIPFTKGLSAKFSPLLEVLGKNHA